MLIDHFNESLVVVALLFLVLPCGAASTSETNSASARDGASVHQFVSASVTQKTTTDALTNDHRRTDALTTDVPLIPQSVPLSSVQSLLDLARHSACRDAARLIEDGSISAALAALDTLTAGAFYWRGAVTNGFQQGFFVNALRGYCLERMGDIVKAYRAYQNSRAYFDDTAVAMQCPEPRLEVFLGLGRTCLVAGRYTDAFNWLDLVRLEASAEPRIAAAADRGLIRRAVEIGDYHDALTNYWDLQAQLANDEYRIRNDECRSEQTEPNHVEAVTGLASTVTGGMGAASAPRTSEDYKFVRPERILSREEHKELAQLFFWTHQDRPGFKTVLDGMTLLGIDNDLGVRDPMVDCFLNNIMRANDAEIQRFYDLLGYAITQARALKGDENYIASLCNARSSLCSAYDDLIPKNDLAIVASRLEAIRQRLGSLEQHYTHLAYRSNKRSAGGIEFPNQSRISQVKQIADSAQTCIEDTIMAADCLALRASPSNLLNAHESRTLYSKALDIMRTADSEGILYDGTTARNAALIGLRLFKVIMTNCHDRTKWLSHQELCMDESMRAGEALVASAHSGTQEFQKICAVVLRRLPNAHHAVLGFIAAAAENEMASQRYMNAYTWWAEYERRSHEEARLYLLWAKSLIAQGQVTSALDKVLSALGRTSYKNELLDMVLGQLYELLSLVPNDDLEQIVKAMRHVTVPISILSQKSQTRVDRLTYALLIERGVSAETELRTAMASMDYNKALKVIAEKFGNDHSQGREMSRARVYLGLGMTNIASQAVWRAYDARCKEAYDVGGEPICYPVIETALYEQLLITAEPERIKHYLRWLHTRHAACVKCGRTEDSARLKDAITRYYIISD